MSGSPSSDADHRALRFAMNLSLGVGLVMLVIKVGAYLITGSTAILSDAAESVVHVAAVVFAAYSLRLAERPPDADHLYGHAKISFFSAAFEGAMISLAALYIMVLAAVKWWQGLELENLGLGTGLTMLAAALNGSLGAYLLWVGRTKRSLIIEANGRHVLTDCWTSLGVIVGLGLTLATGWLPWDPICAIAVALNILVSGVRLIRRGVIGLMDVADPEIDRRLRNLLDGQSVRYGIQYHGLRHRDLGNSFSIEVHFLFPEDTSIKRAHAIATAIERAIEASLPASARVHSHLEAIEDHAVVHAGETHQFGSRPGEDR